MSPILILNSRGFEPEFWVSELTDNPINILVGIWYPHDDPAEVMLNFLKVIKNALDDAGIEISLLQSGVARKGF